MVKDGIDHEDQYFIRQEKEKLAKLKQQADAAEAERARGERKELHFHRCGKCGDAMRTEIFKGVEIEICPGCGAVLLDPGELEALAGADESGILAAIAGFFKGRKE